jgi:hypothetical protein
MTKTDSCDMSQSVAVEECLHDELQNMLKVEHKAEPKMPILQMHITRSKDLMGLSFHIAGDSMLHLPMFNVHQRNLHVPAS